MNPPKKNKPSVSLVMLFTALAALLPSGVSAQSTVAVPNVPDTVNIRLDPPDPVSSGTIQGISARYVNETTSGRRGLSQTFTWNATTGMTGLGLKIMPNSSGSPTFFASQDYLLDVHELSDPVNGRYVNAPLTSIPVAITPQAVVPGQYLFIRFDEPLGLVKGKAYGIHLRPNTLNTTNSLFVGVRLEGPNLTGYADGAGSQTAGLPIEVDQRYGKNQPESEFDLVFFTTTCGAFGAPTTTGDGMITASVSTLPVVPDAVNIRQDAPAIPDPVLSSISARYTSATDIRGLAQTFTWNSTAPLSGFGLKITSSNGKKITTNQNYKLDIQELTDAVQIRTVSATIASIPVNISPASAKEGQYLYIYLEQPITLIKGKTYGFHLKPDQINAANWLFASVRREGTERSGYAEGVGSQTSGTSIMIGSRYGKDAADREFDLVFFTAVDGTFCSPQNYFGDPDAPIVWMQPDSFTPNRPGLGLPQLPDVVHTDLFIPEPSMANTNTGGTGIYEGLWYGTYNHDQQILIHQDKAIVYWVNHIMDEGGPGQRVLAKIGAINPITSDIAWGGNHENLVEIAAPAVPAKRRLTYTNSTMVDNIFIDGQMSSIGGKIYYRGRLMACDGWTGNLDYHHVPRDATHTVPAEYYSSTLTENAKYDIYWHLGDFFQQFEFVNGVLRATSPVYIVAPVPTSLQVNTNTIKTVAPLSPIYAGAGPLDEAGIEIKNAYNTIKDQAAQHVLYAEGTMKLAANGKDALTHWAEFQRADGKWVILRDNLKDTDVFYAAIRNCETEYYSPAIRTCLFGTAMPAAGNLPDNSAWIIGENPERTSMFITYSTDGIVFDRTWLLRYAKIQSAGGMAQPLYEGPAYFQAAIVGQNIWVVYSLAKQQIGITKIPFSSLQAP